MSHNLQKNVHFLNSSAVFEDSDAHFRFLRQKQTKRTRILFTAEMLLEAESLTCVAEVEVVLLGQGSSICKHLLSITASLSPNSQSGDSAVNFDQPSLLSANPHKPQHPDRLRLPVNEPTERIEAGSPSVSTTGSD